MRRLESAVQQLHLEGSSADGRLELQLTDFWSQIGNDGANLAVFRTEKKPGKVDVSTHAEQLGCIC